MDKMTTTEQDLRLAAVYLKMSDEGRDALDMVVQKLAEIKLIPDEAKHADLVKSVLKDR
jgi:hypothetical protein